MNTQNRGNTAEKKPVVDDREWPRKLYKTMKDHVTIKNVEEEKKFLSEGYKQTAVFLKEWKAEEYK